MPIKQALRVNDKIKVKEVRLIDAEGEMKGLVPIDVALDLAKRQELDLVEVAPDSDPPVCKLMDYARYVFEQKRRVKESRKKVKTVEMKEVRMRPKIDPHDFGIKLNQIREFLEKGHKVKVTMRYRGLEMRHYEIGSHILDKVATELAPIAEVDKGSRKAEAARIQSMVIQKKTSRKVS